MTLPDPSDGYRYVVALDGIELASCTGFVGHEAAVHLFLDRYAAFHGVLLDPADVAWDLEHGSSFEFTYLVNDGDPDGAPCVPATYSVYREAV